MVGQLTAETSKENKKKVDELELDDMNKEGGDETNDVEKEKKPEEKEKKEESEE